MSSPSSATGTSLTNPSLMGLVSRSAAADEQGRVLGVNQSLGALSRAVAPTMGGWLYSHWFPGGAFAAAGVLMLAALALNGPAIVARRAVTQ